MRQKNHRGQSQGKLIQEFCKRIAHKQTRTDAPQQQADRTGSLLRKHKVQSWLQEVPSEINEEDKSGMGVSVIGT